MMVLSHESPLQANLTNVLDSTPKVIIGNPIDGHDLISLPVYITLELQDLHLQNCLYDWSLPFIDAPRRYEEVEPRHH